MGRVAIPAPERFWPKVEKTDGCWFWTAAKDRQGHGAFRATTRSHEPMIGAHVFAYTEVIGPVPQGLELDHLCRVRHCVNPAHLEPVTGRVNTLRGESLPAQNARKTHCVNGHPFDADNTAIRSNGNRRCRTCSTQAHRTRRRSE